MGAAAISRGALEDAELHKRSHRSLENKGFFFWLPRNKPTTRDSCRCSWERGKDLSHRLECPKMQKQTHCGIRDPSLRSERPLGRAAIEIAKTNPLQVLPI